MAWVEEASEGAGMDVRSAAIVLAEYGLCMKLAQLCCESVCNNLRSLHTASSGIVLRSSIASQSQLHQPRKPFAHLQLISEVLALCWICCDDI